jgi:hypothetical protein
MREKAKTIAILIPTSVELTLNQSINESNIITFHQWRITPAIIKQFVIIYDNTTTNLMQAILSASASLVPLFLPRALAIIRHITQNLPRFEVLIVVLHPNAYTHR